MNQPAAPTQAGGTLARTSLWTGTGTAASRVTGLLRLVVAAYALGGAPTGDAYNLANNTPNIVHDLVLGGVLTASFIPVFVDQLANRPRREANRSISAVITLSVAVLVLASLLLFVLAPVVIDLYTVGTGGEGTPQALAERALAVDLLRFFAPQVLAYGVISLIAAMLATRDRFIAVGFAPIVNNLVGIAILAAFAVLAHPGEVASGQLTSSHVALLGIGTTAGVFLQAVVLIPSLRRSGFRPRLTWRPRDPAVRTIMRLSGWTLGFVAANQLAVFVIQALEYHLDKVTVYTYAFQFFLFPYAVVAVTIVNVVTPSLARSHVSGDLAAVGRTFGGAARQVVALVLPATIGYLVLAMPIITLVLGHGAFGPVDVTETAATLALFALGLPGFCIYALTIRTFQAMQDTRTAFICYAVENVVNIALAFTLYRPLGVRGLALAYAAAYTAGSVVAVGILRRRLGTIGVRAIAAACGRVIVLSLFMALAIAFTAAVIGTGSGVLGWARLLVTIAVGLLVYLGGAGLAASARGWQTSRRPHH